MYMMYQGRFHSKHVSCTAFQHSNRSLCGTDPPTSSSLHIQLWDIERQKQRTWSDIVDSLLCQTHPKTTKMSPRIICCNAWTWLSLVVKPISCFQQSRCWKFINNLIQVINHQPFNRAQCSSKTALASDLCMNSSLKLKKNKSSNQVWHSKLTRSTCRATASRSSCKWSARKIEANWPVVNLLPKKQSYNIPLRGFNASSISNRTKGFVTLGDSVVSFDTFRSFMSSDASVDNLAKPLHKRRNPSQH